MQVTTSNSSSSNGPRAAWVEELLSQQDVVIPDSEHFFAPDHGRLLVRNRLDGPHGPAIDLLGGEKGVVVLIDDVVRPRDVLVVEHDGGVVGQVVALPVVARQPQKTGLGHGHPHRLVGQVDGALLEHAVDVEPPGIVVHQHIERQLELVGHAPHREVPHHVLDDLEAALALADQGHQVTLVEKKASIGGIMAQLDKTYPTMDCSI